MREPDLEIAKADLKQAKRICAVIRADTRSGSGWKEMWPIAQGHARSAADGFRAAARYNDAYQALCLLMDLESIVFMGGRAHEVNFEMIELAIQAKNYEMLCVTALKCTRASMAMGDRVEADETLCLAEGAIPHLQLKAREPVTTFCRRLRAELEAMRPHAAA